MAEVLTRLVGVFGLVAVAVMFGTLGGWLAIQWWTRQMGRDKTPTPLSPTGYFCEVCGGTALKYRTHDGRRVCLDHKGVA